ncbi:MAG TPA: LuxR C-terminal-related transcriptional regulator, partial [Pseudonocardiaceae bacterium]
MIYAISEKIRTMRVNVIVAIHNDLLRYGVERMAQASDIVAEVRSATELPSSGEIDVDPAKDVLVVTLSEIDAVAGHVLHHWAELGVKILLLLVDEECVELGRLSSVRLSGFLTISELSPQSLSDALAQMDDGQLPISPDLVTKLLAMAGENTDVPKPRPRITPRERETLALLVDGLSNKQIARRLGISEHGAKRLV